MEEAKDRYHSFIGPEHLLVALVSDEGSVASAVLGELQAKAELAHRLDAYLASLKPLRIGASAPAPPVKRVIALALDEADREGNPQIETQHLLLGFLYANEGFSAQVLNEAAVTVTSVRAALNSRTRTEDG